MGDFADHVTAKRDARQGLLAWPGSGRPATQNGLDLRVSSRARIEQEKALLRQILADR